MSYPNTIKTLTQFIIENQAQYPNAKGALTRLLNDIGTAAKIVNREINAAGLVDILGYMGTENIQGEAQKKLDVYANERFIE
ncbi:MAG: class 1 fructose-bisphosphatase, partial [Bacteroidota bacterium]